MPKSHKLTPDNLPDHVDAICEARGLNGLNWRILEHMFKVEVSTASAAKTFGVEWHIMDKWRALWQQRKQAL